MINIDRGLRSSDTSIKLTIRIPSLKLPTSFKNKNHLSNGKIQRKEQQQQKHSMMAITLSGTSICNMYVLYRYDRQPCHLKLV